MAPESFTLSQAYLYGHVDCTAHRVEVADGDFLNIRDNSYAGSLYRDGCGIRDPAARQFEWPESRAVGGSLLECPLDFVEVLDSEPGSAAGGSEKCGLPARSYVADGKYIFFAFRKDGNFWSLAHVIILKLKLGLRSFPFYYPHHVDTKPVSAKLRAALRSEKALLVGLDDPPMHYIGDFLDGLEEIEGGAPCHSGVRK